MAITTDFHLHSNFSGDSDAPMEDMLAKGIELGLTHMCFTEHMDMDFPVTADTPEGMFTLNTDSYLYELLKYRGKYAAKLNVLFGVELGLQPHLSKELAAYAKSYDFDFIIGSSHLCHHKDPYFPAFYEGRSEEAAYREYFSSIIENVQKFTNFDVYGHLDYVVRYGPNTDTDYSYAKYRDLFDELLQLLIDNGKGIEINTGGIKYGLKELNPCTDVLKRYKELGGEIITIGSDAHAPADICNGFDRAAAILSECGFKYYTIFTARQPEFKKL